MECVGNTDATRRQRSCCQAVTRRSGSAAGGATLKHHRWAFFVEDGKFLRNPETGIGKSKGKGENKGAKVRARSFSPGGGAILAAIWPMAITAIT